MENGEADHATDELKVMKMLRVDARVWVNLKGVIFAGGKEGVVGVEHLTGEEGEEFSGEAALIYAGLAGKLDHKSFL